MNWTRSASRQSGTKRLLRGGGVVLGLLAAAAVMVGCASNDVVAPVTGTLSAAASSQPANVGDTKDAATEYYTSGRYEQDLSAVASDATAWVTGRAGQVTKPAVVFDIDETALSNWEVIKADDFGRVIQGPCTSLPEGPCGWRNWDLSSHDTPLQPTLSFFQSAQKLGAATFFITGRDEGQRTATISNLNDAGYTGFTALLMPATGASYPFAADFKTPQRTNIEQQGYTIIANIGDQPSDLEGGHAEKTFLLPDPFYRIP